VITEKKMDLFRVKGDWYLAHCIASDLRMGAGIAVPMQKRFGLRAKIIDTGSDLIHPKCVLTGRIFNLITKARSSGKPTYESFEMALGMMKDQAIEAGVKRIAMPKIGCGLDRLSWAKVKKMIEDAFEGTGIEILVCVWK